MSGSVDVQDLLDAVFDRWFSRSRQRPPKHDATTLSLIADAIVRARHGFLLYPIGQARGTGLVGALSHLGVLTPMTPDRFGLADSPEAEALLTWAALVLSD